MLFTVPIPQTPPNYSVQGLRQLRDQAKGKRPPQFTIAFEAKKPRDLSAFYASLEQQLLDAARQLFVADYQCWLREFSEPLVRVRQLFLVDRDNQVLWDKIQAVVEEWCANLTSELENDFELGQFIQVQLNLRQKFTQLENSLYWFNSMLGESVQSRCLGILDKRSQSLNKQARMVFVSLYNTPCFGEYFMPLHSVWGLQEFMELLALNERSRLPHEMGEFSRAFGTWKAEQQLKWLGITGQPELATALSRQLESQVLRVALENCSIEAAILSSPAVVGELELHLSLYDELLELWSGYCAQAVFNLYYKLQPLEPLLRASVLVDIVGSKNPRLNCVELLNGDPEAAAALARLAVQDMEAQNYRRVQVVAQHVVLMDENRPRTHELGPFLERFGDQMWRELAPRVAASTDVKRFVHGLQLFDSISPEVLMRASVLVGIMERGAGSDILVVPEEYWPVPAPWDGPDAPVPEMPRRKRIYTLDKHSQCTILRNGVETVCSYTTIA